MVPRLIDARYAGQYRVWLRFGDGLEGEIDLAAELWGEMFEPLKDQDLFAKLGVDREIHALVWPNGADLSPEFLYGSLRKMLGPIARTGDPCPESGVWAPLDAPEEAAPVAIGHRMPPRNGQSVSWRLIEHAA